MPWFHRAPLSVISAFSVSAAGSQAVRELAWSDLVPDGSVLPALDSWRDPVATHRSNLVLQVADQQTSIASLNTVSALDGQEVRIPGYLVPLNFAGTAAAESLLVPYFGACIHVPPPPPNQTVHIETDDLYSLGHLFEVVTVTGILRAKPFSSGLAQAGYTITATAVESYAAEPELEFADYLWRFLLVFGILMLGLAFCRWQLTKRSKP